MAVGTNEALQPGLTRSTLLPLAGREPARLWFGTIQPSSDRAPRLSHVKAVLFRCLFSGKEKAKSCEAIGAGTSSSTELSQTRSLIEGFCFCQHLALTIRKF